MSYPEVREAGAGVSRRPDAEIRQQALECSGDVCRRRNSRRVAVGRERNVGIEFKTNCSRMILGRF